MTFNEIESSLEQAMVEHAKFRMGNKSSATRARAHLMVVKKESDKIRKQLIDEKKSMPVKPRVKKVEKVSKP